MLSVRLIKKLEGIEKCSKNGHEGNYHPGDDQ
jgi:hypothetical protein